MSVMTLVDLENGGNYVQIPVWDAKLHRLETLHLPDPLQVSSAIGVSLGMKEMVLYLSHRVMENEVGDFDELLTLKNEILNDTDLSDYHKQHEFKYELVADLRKEDVDQLQCSRLQSELNRRHFQGPPVS